MEDGFLHILNLEVILSVLHLQGINHRVFHRLYHMHSSLRVQLHIVRVLACRLKAILSLYVLYLGIYVHVKDVGVA